MAQKLLSLEEAADKIGVSQDELKSLIDRRDVYAVKDGNEWKIKEDEVERYMSSPGTSAVGSGLKLDIPLEDDDSESKENGGPESELVTESAVGASAPSSSTIIGKDESTGGADDSDLVLSTGDSDPKLADAESALSDDSDLKVAAGDSGVALIAADDDEAGKSGLKLVPSDSDVGKWAAAQKEKAQAKSGSDLDLVDMDAGDSGLPVDTGSDLTLGSDPTLDSDASPTFDSDAEAATSDHAGSDLSLGSDVLNLADDNEINLMDEESELRVADEGGSDLVLGSSGDLDDDEIVLGGSSVVGSAVGGTLSSGVGSGIGDSGINLEAANDSGLSLEEPLELAGEELSADEESDELEEISDDDFLLTPMLELDDQESDSSGSQVIALDTDEAFDDQAATMLGEDAPAMATVEDTTQMAGGAGAAQPVVQPAGVAAMTQPTVEAPYGGLALTLLVFCFLFLVLTGIMMFEMVQHIWSWGQPGEASTFLMDTVIDLLPKD